LAVSIAIAATVGDQVELKTTHQAGVPLHQEPRGTNDFQRLPDGTRAQVIDVAKNGQWLKLSLPDGRTGWVTSRYAAGVKIAPWLRHLVRQITMTDFPASWQEARSEERSHDSHTYDTRFMLRLDESSQTKLQQLVKQFGVPKAEIIRQLIVQAEPKDFPSSWQMRAAEHRVQPRYRSL